MQYNSSCCVLDIHKIMQIAYSENFQALFRHVNDVGTDTVHEILRVRDDNKNATIPEKYGDLRTFTNFIATMSVQNVILLLQVLLQPDTSLQIQVIGRFIQQQHRRLDEQRTRQRKPHTPTSRETLHLNHRNTPMK